MRGPDAKVALVGVNRPGYRSLALAYLEAAVAADPRLSTVSVIRFDVDVTVDPWRVAYRLCRLDPQPDIVALPVFCFTARHVFELARVVDRALPGVKVVAGGPEVGPLARDVLIAQPSIDAVVRGEGERAFCDLLFAYMRGGDPGSVPGVTARVDGAVVEGPQREPVADLDTIASPYQGRAHPTDGSVYLETYRGCPHRCAYCYEGKGERRIRSFSWERIAADIDAVASVPGMRSFSFIDPVFNLSTERLERLAAILEPYAARGLQLHTIEVDIERVDEQQAALLKRAGVVSVEAGPQSVGRRALELVRRAFDPERFRAGVEACRSAGIAVECDLIIGLPGDTDTDVLSGIEFVLGLDPGRVQLSTLHVLPGTELWSRADELGVVFDPEPPHEVIATRELAFDELRRLEELGNAVAAVYRARVAPKGDAMA